jgi:predicted TIM-barrel fold metal-dependent hydrolase
MDEDSELAELKSVSVNEYFDHEEKDFTPWLAENISLLEHDDLLNIPLEVQQREASVGRYRADIVARDPETDRTVVIENQFGETDHTHLGQSLVYTAGMEADIVVWIAENFTDEHASVLRWLNDRTDEEAAFF